MVELTERDRDYWVSVPFTGCDGVPKTGQEWVKRGLLAATVVAPPTAGLAMEVLAKALRTGSVEELTLAAPRSYPGLEELNAKAPQPVPASSRSK